MSLLVVALPVLISGQSPAALGIELLVLAVALVALAIRMQGQTIRRLQPGQRAR